MFVGERRRMLALGLGTDGGGLAFGLPPSDVDELCLLDIVRCRDAVSVV